MKKYIGISLAIAVAAIMAVPAAYADKEDDRPVEERVYQRRANTVNGYMNTANPNGPRGYIPKDGLDGMTKVGKPTEDTGFVP